MKCALIFDLDGTLVDSLAGIANSLNFALTASGFDVHVEEIVRGFIGNGARVLIQRAAPANASDKDHEATEAAFKAHYDTNWHTGTSIYEGITALLETLQARGYPLAILSNKPHDFTVAIATRIFPRIRFDAVLGQRDGTPHKPDPTGALEIAKMLGRDPVDCALIGDSTVDIDTARNAGMRAIAVTWGFHDRDRLLAAKADAIATNAAEVEAMFC